MPLELPTTTKMAMTGSMSRQEVGFEAQCSPRCTTRDSRFFCRLPSAEEAVRDRLPDQDDRGASSRTERLGEQGLGACRMRCELVCSSVTWQLLIPSLRASAILRRYPTAFLQLEPGKATRSLLGRSSKGASRRWTFPTELSDHSNNVATRSTLSSQFEQCRRFVIKGRVKVQSGQERRRAGVRAV